ncbi:hypothetical protein LVB77_12570 [Lysobacter sp. 5GHs7-4]|uniref:hypothetical protein n=1 Tax=Lysobacter sp. 5GHs7-4 TaxID=2904253 RepID=UPI001E2E6ABD|nr:hypothetical protein [Lysobacter sp. 5GHs7-4]UHQ21516.1 hypothetical protein LVB77_12570 [Lysobacter sp. 5GHs7-4]
MEIFVARTLLLVLLTVAHPLAYAAEPFPSFEVSPLGQPEPRFQFSQALASNNDPVVISVAGRNLRKKDREHRVDLQKYWLQRNVPADYKIVVRSLVECPPKKPKQFGACDEYVFTDAAGAEHSYSFYVGNWP